MASIEFQTKRPVPEVSETGLFTNALRRGLKNRACLRFKSRKEACLLFDYAFFLVDYVTK